MLKVFPYVLITITIVLAVGYASYQTVLLGNFDVIYEEEETEELEESQEEMVTENEAGVDIEADIEAEPEEEIEE